MRKAIVCFIMMMAVFSLTGCYTDTAKHYVPVIDAATIEHIPKTGVYRVMPGETLYSIAWRYGLDYRYLASRNQIAPPYHIEVGQLIYLRGRPTSVVRTSSPSVPTKDVQSAPVYPAVSHEPNAAVSHWRWPARGPIIGNYSALNKGINIAGHKGAPIRATAAGLVVYSGNGLRGYGNLIIIKHNSKFLTAYAHASEVLVKQGEWVKSGQEIAEMGDTGSRRVMLHFEIRKNGQPVNPLNYLSR